MGRRAASCARRAPVALKGQGPAQGRARLKFAGQNQAPPQLLRLRKLEIRRSEASASAAPRARTVTVAALGRREARGPGRSLKLTEKRSSASAAPVAAANSQSRPAPVPARARASSPGSSEPVVRRWSSWPEPAYALVNGKSKRERARVKRARAGRARACIAFARIAAACRRCGSASVPRGCRIRPGPPPCVCVARKSACA